jgi:ribose 5-phosphate isomerase B
MRIYTGSDHAGFDLRSKLVTHLKAQGHDVVDFGPADAASVDYPDYAARVARAVRGEPGSRGLLVCGSGVGMSIAANKVGGVRAALAWNAEVARLSRAHNDANIVCVGSRLVTESDARAIVDAFFGGPFDGGRHANRIAKIAAIETEERDSKENA